jgi:hypothetical protein
MELAGLVSDRASLSPTFAGRLGGRHRRGGRVAAMSDEPEQIIEPLEVRVSKRFTCRFEAYERDGAGAILTIWSPHPPAAELSGSAMRKYQRARLAFAQRLAEHLGEDVLVVEGRPPPGRTALTAKPILR